MNTMKMKNRIPGIQAASLGSLLAALLLPSCSTPPPPPYIPPPAEKPKVVVVPKPRPAPPKPAPAPAVVDRESPEFRVGLEPIQASGTGEELKTIFNKGR